MYAVMLSPKWPAKFSRSVRDGEGKIVKTLVFESGEPQLLDDSEFMAVKGDIGKSLAMSQVDSDGIPTGRVATGEVQVAEKSKRKAR